MREALDVESNPGSVELMEYIDAMPRAMRRLVHEYGFTIVAAMIEDGYTDAKELRGLLEVWRERKQQQALAIDHFRKRRRET